MEAWMDNRDVEFFKWCEDLLRQEIRVMRPVVIAAMGRRAWAAIDGISTNRSWTSYSVSSVPAEPIEAEVAGVQLKVVPLLHPTGSGRFRHFRGYNSTDELVTGEATALMQAWRGTK